MSDLFFVTVLEKGKDWVDLKLVIIHPDQHTFPENRSFALMLIWEPTFISYDYQGETVFTHDPSALSQISPDQILDADYVKKTQDEVLKSVQILGTDHFSGSQNRADMALEESDICWSDWETLPYAIMRITVTAPKWIGHLQEGMSWSSTAHPVVK